MPGSVFRAGFVIYPEKGLVLERTLGSVILQPILPV